MIEEATIDLPFDSTRATGRERSLAVEETHGEGEIQRSRTATEREREVRRRIIEDPPRERESSMIHGERGFRFVDEPQRGGVAPFLRGEPPGRETAIRLLGAEERDVSRERERT